MTANVDKLLRELSFDELVSWFQQPTSRELATESLSTMQQSLVPRLVAALQDDTRSHHQTVIAITCSILSLASLDSASHLKIVQIASSIIPYLRIAQFLHIWSILRDAIGPSQLWSIELWNQWWPSVFKSQLPTKARLQVLTDLGADAESVPRNALDVISARVADLCEMQAVDSPIVHACIPFVVFAIQKDCSEMDRLSVLLLQLVSNDTQAMEILSSIGSHVHMHCLESFLERIAASSEGLDTDEHTTFVCNSIRLYLRHSIAIPCLPRLVIGAVSTAFSRKTRLFAAFSYCLDDVLSKFVESVSSNDDQFLGRFAHAVLDLLQNVSEPQLERLSVWSKVSDMLLSALPADIDSLTGVQTLVLAVASRLNEHISLAAVLHLMRFHAFKPSSKTISRLLHEELGRIKDKSFPDPAISGLCRAIVACDVRETFDQDEDVGVLVNFFLFQAREKYDHTRLDCLKALDHLIQSVPSAFIRWYGEPLYYQLAELFKTSSRDHLVPIVSVLLVVVFVRDVQSELLSFFKGLIDCFTSPRFLLADYGKEQSERSSALSSADSVIELCPFVSKTIRKIGLQSLHCWMEFEGFLRSNTAIPLLDPASLSIFLQMMDSWFECCWVRLLKTSAWDDIASILEASKIPEEQWKSRFPSLAYAHQSLSKNS